MSEKKELSNKNPDQTYKTAVKALISAVPILGGPFSCHWRYSEHS